MATSSPVPPPPIMTDKVIEDLEKQVEEQSQRILDLKESLAQKEALYLATCEKLCSSENKRIELETSLVSLATSDVVDGKRQAFFLDISKKTQGQKNSSGKKLKQIFQKTQANNSKTQYFAN